MSKKPNVDELRKQLKEIRAEMDELLLAGPAKFAEKQDRYNELRDREKEILSVLWWVR